MGQDKDVYDRAIRVWGHNAQILTAIGECAELIDALVKRQRGQLSGSEADEHVIDEIADVKIMVRQLEKIFGEQKVQARETYKITKIHDRLNKAEGGRLGELS